jgi:hypothetical protein
MFLNGTSGISVATARYKASRACYGCVSQLRDRLRFSIRPQIEEADTGSGMATQHPLCASGLLPALAYALTANHAGKAGEFSAKGIDDVIE